MERGFRDAGRFDRSNSHGVLVRVGIVSKLGSKKLPLYEVTEDLRETIDPMEDSRERELFEDATEDTEC